MLATASHDASFSNFKSLIFQATRQHAFFQSINILIPKSWSSIPDAEPATGQLFEDAEFRVDVENPAYRDNPYTKQNGECGKEGHFVHITPWFVKNHKGDAAAMFGRTDKVISYANDTSGIGP